MTKDSFQNETYNNKNFYLQSHDKIFEKRFNSPFPVRRQVHHEIYDSILQYITPGMKVLDAGCGEGILSLLMAQKGAHVVGGDLSLPNIEGARTLAEQWSGLNLNGGSVEFINADAENLPFPDNSFDLVVSNHVLEHLPNFDQGLNEVLRVAKQRVIIAIPTCLSACSWTLLGKSNYWKFGKRSLFALILGFAKVLVAFLKGQVGVDEGYGGDVSNIHIHRFPWILLNKLKQIQKSKEFQIDRISFEAQTLQIPYVPSLRFSSLRRTSFFRNLGLGTLYIVDKKK